MRLLLDTHALLWVIEDSPKLSAAVRASLNNPMNEIFVSAASAYEICLKHVLGKLPGAAILARDFAREIGSLACTPLSITVDHAAAAGLLDPAHRDPFDRLLIAQASVEGMTLVSNETLFDAYGVARLW